MIILNHLAEALKMDGEEMRELFRDGVQSMRMNYYPPCPEPDKAIGFSAHSDANALTILLQLNETEGLQIRKDGRWVSVKPIPNAFVVNIGNIIEVRNEHVFGLLVMQFVTIIWAVFVNADCKQWRIQEH